MNISSRAGFSLNQLLLSVVALCGIAGGTHYYMRHVALAEEAKKNLNLIYMALEWYEMENGQLPDLAFFPENPREDGDSLLVALKRFGVDERMTVCPSAPQSIQDLGLNYVWNVRLNGRRLYQPGLREWVLVDIHAISPSVPYPYLRGYSILFSDGVVEWSKVPPTGLRI
jgi:hypothetical protein